MSLSTSRTTPRSASARYPLKVSENRRHLVDQNDQPVLVHGDSPWSLIVGPTPEEAEIYLADRVAKGFNTLLVNLIEHKFTPNAPCNFRGDAPFTTSGVFSTPNETYFQHADWVIRRTGEVEAGRPISSKGEKHLTPPDASAGGDGVVIIDDQAKGPPAPAGTRLG